jgi:hypothetical protein
MKIYTGASTIKSILAFFVLSLISISSISQASISCDEAMGVKPALYNVSEKGKIKIAPELGELFIETASSQLNSTTGNRTEFKRTVLVENLQEALKKLGQTFELKPRDAIKPGTKNVTVTHYLNVLKFEYKGQELQVKIRFRKYGTIKAGLANTPENVQINPDMKDVSFLEFKIDHPDFENSVLKPRGLQNDSDINLIGTAEYVKQFDQILGRAVEKNSKNKDSIETMTKMQNLLKRLHEEGVPLRRDSRTIYERNSYALPINTASNKKSYEIQITMDEGILLYSYPHNKTVDAYKSDKPLTVVELKIPVEMVDKTTKGFDQTMLKAIPLLGSIQTFLNDLTLAQAPGYEANRGKQSLIRALLEGKE